MNPDSAKVSGLIFQAQVGSGLYGTALPGTDDRDEMGICLEAPSSVTGLDSPFQQYEHHTAWDRPGGRANRSGPGDLDVVVYSARKWARLTTFGNPTTTLLLFVDRPNIVFTSPVAEELLTNSDKFISRQVAPRFIGYLISQYDGLIGKKKPRVNRSDRVGKHGYDGKYAMHALRLGLQGVQLLSTGRIPLPIPEPHLSFLRDVRRGEVPFMEVTAAIERHLTKLDTLRETSSLPDQPDYGWVNNWLHETHLDYWEKAGSLPHKIRII